MTEKKTTKKTTTGKKETAEKIVEKKKTTNEYVKAVGRRKTSVAQIRIIKNGKGEIIVNSKPIEKYFHENKSVIALQPLKMAGNIKDVDLSIIVKGGGVNSQTEAVRHGIARALILIDPELRLAFKSKDWLTRDSRRVERKKPGLKKARRAPQWSKR